MRTIALLLFLLCLAVAAPGQAIVVHRPVNVSGALIQSSWVFPDGSDGDNFAYEPFILAETTSITDVEWMGGYIYNAAWGRANNFSITFYASNVTGFEPLLGYPDTEEALALAQYEIGSNAEETPAGGGRYTYHATLATPFVATAGVKYWIRILAYQPTISDWASCQAQLVDGWYFRYSTGSHMFQKPPGDVCFTMLTTIGPAYDISTAASPVGGGATSGGNSFAPGAAVKVVATAANGHIFTAWVEGTTIVSTSSTYTFTASGDRALTAVFEPKPTARDTWSIR